MVFADRNSRPVAPERIVHDAAQALAPQARGAGEAGELEGRDELLPAVRSRLEPAQDIFGADNARAKLLKVQLTVATRTRGIRQERYTSGPVVAGL